MYKQLFNAEAHWMIAFRPKLFGRLKVHLYIRQWRKRGGGADGISRPGRITQGVAKQPHRKYFTINYHKSECGIVFLMGQK